MRMHLLVLPVLAGTLLCGVAASAQDAADDPVVARVDGEDLRRSDVEAGMAELPEQYRQVPFEMLYNVLLERAIETRLLADKAQAEGVADDPAVQRNLERVRTLLLRDGLLGRHLEESGSEEALRALYEERKAAPDFAVEEAHVRHVLVGSEEEARSVIEELEGGAEFEALARERSTDPSAEQNGGDLGWIRSEQVVPSFGEAAFALEPGGRTEQPVQSDFGWHVIETVETRTVEPSFEELEPQLRQEVAQRIYGDLLAEAREGAEIERFALDGSPLPETPMGEAPAPAEGGAAPAPAEGAAAPRGN